MTHSNIMQPLMKLNIITLPLGYILYICYHLVTPLLLPNDYVTMFTLQLCSVAALGTKVIFIFHTAVSKITSYWHTAIIKHSIGCSHPISKPSHI